MPTFRKILEYSNPIPNWNTFISDESNDNAFCRHVFSTAAIADYLVGMLYFMDTANVLSRGDARMAVAGGIASAILGTAGYAASVLSHKYDPEKGVIRSVLE